MPVARVALLGLASNISDNHSETSETIPLQRFLMERKKLVFVVPRTTFFSFLGIHFEMSFHSCLCVDTDDALPQNGRLWFQFLSSRS
jgi:hypothetical protein